MSGYPKEVKMKIGERIKLFLYKLLNLLSGIVYYGLRIGSLVCWAFVLNNLVSAVFGNIWYRLAGSPHFYGKAVLWLLNNIYLKSEAIQYFLIFMSSKAVWIAILSSFGIRFGRWLYNLTRIAEYKHYLRMGYISNRPQVIVQNNGASEDAVQIANLRAEIAEQKLEIERLKNAAIQNTSNIVPIQSVQSNQEVIEG